MAKPARQRETENNLRAIYRWHPQFAGGDFIKYFGDEDINYDHATLGRRKVLAVIGRGAVLIDMSERTTPQGVEFWQALFKHRRAERVIAVELPKHRSLYAP